jgi:hypothetical protein
MDVTIKSEILNKKQAAGQLFFAPCEEEPQGAM